MTPYLMVLRIFPLLSIASLIAGLQVILGSFKLGLVGEQIFPVFLVVDFISLLSSTVSLHLLIYIKKHHYRVTLLSSSIVLIISFILFTLILPLNSPLFKLYFALILLLEKLGVGLLFILTISLVSMIDTKHSGIYFVGFIYLNEIFYFVGFNSAPLLLYRTDFISIYAGLITVFGISVMIGIYGLQESVGQVNTENTDEAIYSQIFRVSEMKLNLFVFLGSLCVFSIFLGFINQVVRHLHSKQIILFYVLVIASLVISVVFYSLTRFCFLNRSLVLCGLGLVGVASLLLYLSESGKNYNMLILSAVFGSFGIGFIQTNIVSEMFASTKEEMVLVNSFELGIKMCGVIYWFYVAGRLGVYLYEVFYEVEIFGVLIGFIVFIGLCYEIKKSEMKCLKKVKSVVGGIFNKNSSRSPINSEMELKN